MDEVMIGSSVQCLLPHIRLGVHVLVSKQFEWVEAENFCHSLQGLQSQVALAALDTAHVGPVDTHDLGERLLAIAAFLPVPAQIAPHDLLQLTFHNNPLRFRVAT